jgi:hypothetical protein
MRVRLAAVCCAAAVVLSACGGASKPTAVHLSASGYSAALLLDHAVREVRRLAVPSLTTVLTGDDQALRGAAGAAKLASQRSRLARGQALLSRSCADIRALPGAQARAKAGTCASDVAALRGLAQAINCEQTARRPLVAKRRLECSLALIAKDAHAFATAVRSAKALASTLAAGRCRRRAEAEAAIDALRTAVETRYAKLLRCERARRGGAACDARAIGVLATDATTLTQETRTFASTYPMSVCEPRSR